MSVQTGDKLVTVDEVKAAYDSAMSSSAVETATITLDSTIVGTVSRNVVRRSGHVVMINIQFDFKTLPTAGTSYDIGTLPVGFRPNYSCEFAGEGAGSGWRNTDLSSFNFANSGVITVTVRGTPTTNWYVLNAVYLIP